MNKPRPLVRLGGDEFFVPIAFFKTKARQRVNAPGRYARKFIRTMNSVSQPLPAVKLEDTSGERDLMLTALRVAATRTRLQTNVFDCIGVALRQKQVDCADALAWLREEGLLDHLPFGAGVVR